MKNILSQIKKHCEIGESEFNVTMKLSEDTSNVPKGYGAYIIYANGKKCENIVYIGKGGTINNNGDFEKQQLRERLNNQQHEMRREDFFKWKMSQSKNLHKLIIQWLIIKDNSFMPAFLEALLIQLYYSKYHKLPLWNRSF